MLESDGRSGVAGRMRATLTAVSVGLVLAALLLGATPAMAAAATTPSTAPAASVGTDPAGGGSAGTGSAGTGSTSPTRATDIASVATALLADPLYVSTAPGTPPVVAGDVRGTLPQDVYVAVLPTSAADQVGGEAAALPGAILSQLSRPGTVLVLAGSELNGASRTQRFDRLQQVLTDARAKLATGQAAPALVLAARGLAGSGQLSDAPSASRAGSPSGGGFLWVVLGLVLAAVLAIPVLLRRARRPAPEPPPRVLRDRVEVDAYGRVVRRVSAGERADEQDPAGRPPRSS